MNKRIALIVISILLVFSLTGCGLVTVVPIGQEGQFTGVVAFNSDDEASSDWTQVASEITEKSTDLAALLAGDGIASGSAAAVSGKGTIIEFNTDTPKHYMMVSLDGYEGKFGIKILAGGVISGTAIRDVQTLKGFQSFTNQTEWSQYGKSLNAKMKALVIEPLALNEAVAGKTITFYGAATADSSTVTVTPVSVTIE